MMSIEFEDFETRKYTVNNTIRICIECGNTHVKIIDLKIHCHNCNSTFQIEENC